MEGTPGFCSKCGTSLRPTAKFCPNCGAVVKPLEATPVTPPASLQETPPVETPAMPPTRIVPETPPVSPQPAQAPRAAQPTPPPLPGTPRRRTWLYVLLGIGVLALGCCVVAGMILAGSAIISPERAAETPSTAKHTATQPGAVQSTSQATSPAAVLPAPTDDGVQTWLVLLYQDADDEILEKDIYIDLNEAELVGSTGQVTVISQIDRYKGAFTGDGNWTTTKRFLLTPDGALEEIASQELDDLGEIDSGNYTSLVDFATWAIQNYPADKYVMILSDHGSGWAGGWSDDDPTEGSKFVTNDFDRALAEIIFQTGIGQFEVVGFDACLMNQVEVLSALSPYARYAVASEEVEPAIGWAYLKFMNDLTTNPQMSGADLARSMVESYIKQDVRVVDDNARRVFLQEVGADETLSAEEVARELMRSVTMSAVDLSQMKQVNQALNQLAVSLNGANQSIVARARTYAQSYTSVFGKDVQASYLDLGHFASLLEEELSDNPDVVQAAQELRSAIEQAVIAEVHGPEKPGSTGISFFFPNSALFQQTNIAGQANVNYTSDASRFAAASLWDDFLHFHYTGQSFDPASPDLALLEPFQGQPLDVAALVTPAPVSTGQVTAPGTGEITILPFTVSATVVPANGSVTLSTEVHGNNIGYIYIFALYYSETANAYLTADIDFILSDNTSEIDGVYYPDWGTSGVIPIEFNWEPTVYFLSNGVDEVYALFPPQVYGTSAENTLYAARGIYTFAGSGDQRVSLVYFDANGKMTSILGFANADGSGAPREITPQNGDAFTVIEEWVVFDQNPDGEFKDFEGGTLAYQGQPFKFVAKNAYSGNYLLGLYVEDVDGNASYQFVEITVTD